MNRKDFWVKACAFATSIYGFVVVIFLTPHDAVLTILFLAGATMMFFVAVFGVKGQKGIVLDFEKRDETK